MLVYENSQVQGPDGIGNAAGKAEELEGIMSISQQSSTEGYLTKWGCSLFLLTNQQRIQ